MPLKGFATDLTDVLPFLAVGDIMFAEGAGAAEDLSAEATVQERGLQGAPLVLSFLPAARSGSASLFDFFRGRRGRKPQL